ncbi:SRPBCC family protein [Phycicoccus sonneratiae]|uniref:SRPBCC domain-containing protein n=1 Tax=Phycicoccus sonneratiae TaxID=2807628 RepID=A0ABS2CGV6_9MICO|nr:SRPBCC domain-containing protein [Phycicoccus sonneraticus]MBM6399010.1 SRPBCC domain-containing protein [Phycicoccus sonneraticus]
MPVTDITQDVENRTLTIRAEFAAPVERVWALYADPRQLEKVWGPPEYPATFVDHELRPGTRSTYYMTSPEGERFGGYWDITGVEEPSGFTYDDGFANADLTPNPSLPVSHNVYAFAAGGPGTQATYTSTYDTAEDLQKVLDMGMEEGARSAIDQIDGFLARG